MRSWNNKSCAVFRRACALFAIYQWGVETTSKKIKEGRWKKFAIYQWGVETRFQVSEKFPVFPVRNLPMRSWNTKLAYFERNFTSVRNLPMRSWNHTSLNSSGFRNQLFAIYQWGVETQNFVPSNLKTHQGSQFTNEELKLLITIIGWNWKL